MMVLNQRQFSNLANNEDYYLLRTKNDSEVKLRILQKKGDVVKVKVNAKA